MKKRQLLTAYCIGYGNWTVIPHQWDECFGEMRDLGFDAVALTFSESEMKYARRTFEMQVAAAHRASLEVYVIPSRIGGRVAGAPLMGSIWLNDHPDIRLPEFNAIACAESPEFRQWSREFIEGVVSDYEVDGIIWDEPKIADHVTTHPEAVAALGADYGPEDACRSFAELIGEWTAAARRIRPELVVSIFNMPKTNPVFTRMCAQLPGIDYAGYDGGLSLQSYFHEKPTKHKPYLWESWPRTQKECAEAGCGSFALIENMLLPASEHSTFARNLEKYLDMASPDHLSCYYYAHNNEAPEEAHRLVSGIISRYYMNKQRRFA